MYIHYRWSDYVKDLLYIPETSVWKLESCLENDTFLQLTIDGRVIFSKTAEDWLSCEDDFPSKEYKEVGYFYEEVVDTVKRMIFENPDIKVIDLAMIEENLFENKYKKEWVRKGFTNGDLKLL